MPDTDALKQNTDEIVEDAGLEVVDMDSGSEDATSDDSAGKTVGEKVGEKVKEKRSMLSKRIKSMIILGFRQFWDPYYQGYAAQIAFYIIMSFVPTLVLIAQVLSLVNVSIVSNDMIIDRMADPEVGRLLKRLLSTRLDITSNITMIITMFWGSSRVQFALMRLSNYLYSNGRTTGDFIVERARSLKNLSFTVFIFAFVCVILVNGPMFIELLFGNILEGTYVQALWKFLRWPITALLYFMVVLHNYWMLPNYKLKIKRLTIKDVVPGSIFAAVGMLIVTTIYSKYTSLGISNMSAIYGSMASIVGLLMWFYLMSWVMVLGMLFNKVWMDTKDIDNVNVGY